MGERADLGAGSSSTWRRLWLERPRPLHGLDSELGGRGLPREPLQLICEEGVEGAGVAGLGAGRQAAAHLATPQIPFVI